MAYNPMTDCTHYKVFSAYTDRYSESYEVTNHKVATICVPNYGVTFDEGVKAALARQGINAGYSVDDGFFTDDFGDVSFYLEE